MLATVLTAAAPARAQTIPPSFRATIAITGASSTRTVNLGAWLDFDAASGALSLPVAGTDFGTGSKWSWTTDTINPLTNEAQLAMTWNSDVLVDVDGILVPDTTISFFKAGGNVDPFLTYSYAVKNNTGAPQSYTFTFGESLIPPITGGYLLYADLSGAISNASDGSSATIAPTVPDGNGDIDGIAEIQTLWLSPDGGTTLINAGVDVGAAFTTTNAPGTTIYGPHVSSLTSSGMFDYWEIQAKFTLSPNKDAVGFAGFAEIVPIPEPATYAALGGLTVFLIALARRRRIFSGRAIATQ